MNQKRMPRALTALIFMFCWALAFAVSGLADNRSLTFTPSDPIAGQQLLFTASGFSSPYVLKWEMGDGTVLTTGGKASSAGEAILAYAYSTPGTYMVRVFDQGGTENLPPITVMVTVSARSREKTVTASEKPLQAERPKDPPREIVEKPIQSEGAEDLPDQTSEKPRPVAPAAVSVPAAAAPVRARKKYPFIKIGPYAGYFRPQDMWVKKIYGEGDAIYGARLGVHIWKGFYFWLSAAQFKTIAETTFSKDRTALTLLPISTFLRYRVRLGFFRPYAGIGYTYLSFKEESEIGNVTGNGNNAAYEAGFELKINRNFLLDLGARYDQIKVKPTGFEIELGGVQAGISLLISF